MRLKIWIQGINNEVEYKAFIVGFHLAIEMQVDAIEIFSDSQLVVCQIIKEYQARSDRMVAYVAEARHLLEMFQRHMIKKVSRC